MTTTQTRTTPTKNAGRVHTYLILGTVDFILALTAIVSAALLEFESAAVSFLLFSGLSLFIATYCILDTPATAE
jgi:hypothetical protein